MDLRARVRAAREMLWGQWWFRIMFVIWAGVSGYDTFSGVISQIIPKYELVPLGPLLVGGSHLLPWWGWLLILQGMLWASLAEYVLRHIPALLSPTREGLAADSASSTTTASPLAKPEPSVTARIIAPEPQPSFTPRASPTAAAAPSPHSYDYEPQADFRAWRHANPLTLRQAASLWGGKDPAHLNLFPLRGAEAAWLQTLLNAVEQGKLAVQPNPSGQLAVGGAEHHALVARAELARFALAINETPTFLAEDIAIALMVADDDFAPAPEEPPETALWIESVKFSYHAHADGKLEKGILTLDVSNKTHRELRGIKIGIAPMTKKDGSAIASGPSNVLASPKTLRPGAHMPVTLMTREISRRGPWKLNFDIAPTALALDEGTTFNLILLADQENVTRAVLKVAIRNGKSSVFKLTDQRTEQS